MKLTERFLKYDVEAIQQGAQKNLGTRKSAHEAAETRDLEGLSPDRRNMVTEKK